MATRPAPSPLDLLITDLRTLTEAIGSAEAGGNPTAIKKSRKTLDEIAKQLATIAAGLDPVIRPNTIFDPGEPKTAGQMIALTLVAQEKHPLNNVPEFYGAGVYAIYYKGDFAPYEPWSAKDHPLYVGKADPDNNASNDAISQGMKLSARLREHAKNIAKATTTLSITDFDCRFLIVQTGFQIAAEEYLIKMFRPVWNSKTDVCGGLGKHGDSADTRGNKRSPWDTLHPGRTWAARTTGDQKTEALILSQLAQHALLYPPFHDIHDIFKKFMADMRQLAPPIAT